MTDIADVLALRGTFAAMPAISRVALTTEMFRGRLAVTSGLGYSGIVMLDFLRRRAPSTEIHFIDTRQHFDETLELLDMLRDEWKLNITVVSFPFMGLLERLIGKEAWKSNPNLCCHYRKVDPLLRLLRGKDAWMSAVRRDQSKQRSSTEAVELDKRGIIRVNPLYDWTTERIWNYIRDKGLPYNELNDRGFLSVGCRLCTSPVDSGGEERDGRWEGSKKTECGLFI